MPRHYLTGPDEQEYYTDGPEGSTREQALKMAPQLLKAGKLHPVEPVGPKLEDRDPKFDPSLGSLGKAAASLPGSAAQVGSDLWYVVTHLDDVSAAVKEKGIKGVFADVWQDIKDHYGTLGRAQKTFEEDPARFLLDVASVAPTGVGAAAKVVQGTAKVAGKVLPEVVARTSGMAPEVMRTAREAGQLGPRTLEGAEFKAGLKGQPSPAAVPTGAGAASTLAAQQRVAPFGQAGAALRGAGFMPDLSDPKVLAKIGAGYVGGVPWWAAPALSPRGMGATMYGLGALERGAGKVPLTLSRTQLRTAAVEMLRDKETKDKLSGDEIKTLRKATRDSAPSDTLMAASSIMRRIAPTTFGAGGGPRPPMTLTPEEPGQPAYGGTGAEQSAGGARAVATPPVPQTPGPGEASQPAGPGPEAQAAQAAAEAAAERQRRGVRPAGGRGLEQYEKPDEPTPTEETLRGLLIPKTPLEVGLLAAGPAGRLAGPAGRIAAPAIGAMMTSGEAEAGPVGKLWSKLISGEGFALPGKEFSKASTKALEEIKGLPKGTGPLDLSGKLRSDVPQVPIPRYEPPRGIPARMQEALADPKVIEGVRESMKRGVKMGADKWYHNEPIRQAFLRELGDKKGAREFARFMDYTAATSPRSDVPTNIRNASYYYLMTGRELPEKLPYPYGHMAQALHRGNISKLEEAMRSGTVGAEHVPEYRGWDIFANPKPVSFSEDLQGNLAPVAADTHAVRNITMRTGDPRFLETQIQEAIKPGAKPSEFQRTYGEIAKTPKGIWVVRYRPQQLVESGRMSMKEAQQVAPFWVGKPREAEYGAVEKFYSDLSKRLKLAPAEGQAAAWSGAGELTGLGTVPDQTFVEMFNSRVLYTSMMRGEKPEQTLRAFIRKEKPLLGFGGAGMLGSSLLREQDDEPTGDR